MIPSVHLTGQSIVCLMDYVQNPSFDPVLAQSAGRDPEATPTSPPTVAVSSTKTGTSQTGNPAVSTSGTGTLPNPTSTNSGGGGGGTKNNTGAIAGGACR